MRTPHRPAAGQFLDALTPDGIAGGAQFRDHGLTPALPSLAKMAEPSLEMLIERIEGISEEMNVSTTPAAR